VTVDLIKILNQTGTDMIQMIQNNLASTGSNATLQTSESLEFQIDDQGETITLTLLGRPFFATVETGRRPTPDLKPSKSMIDNITEWVAARGLDANMVWAVAVQITKEGTKLWQQGGRTDIYTDPIDNMIGKIQKDILETFALAFNAQVAEIFSNVPSFKTLYK
jgi:hypothetical protein